LIIEGHGYKSGKKRRHRIGGQCHYYMSELADDHIT